MMIFGTDIAIPKLASLLLRNASEVYVLSEKRIYLESLNKSTPVLGGSFAATFWLENIKIHKEFLRFSNLNLQKNLSTIPLHVYSDLP